MSSRFSTALLLALLAGAATTHSAMAAGNGAAAVRRQAVASMVVTGEIAIDERGHVISHQIDQADKVPAGVVGLFANAVPHWQFEPVVVDGVARSARSKMRVRVVARKLDNGDYAVTFQHADFRGKDPTPGEFPSGKVMVRPVYPEPAVRAGSTAMVFVVVKVGPTGVVEEAAVEQVNLAFYGPEGVMNRFRKIFGEAGLRAAKQSTFNPATIGDAVGKSVVVRVPYAFQMAGRTLVDVPYGQWATYVPGPYQPAPWQLMTGHGSPDLMAGTGGPEPMTGEPGLRLLTPLGEGG